jgi:tetratricopeptide (TPR) repeat protein
MVIASSAPRGCVAYAWHRNRMSGAFHAVIARSGHSGRRISTAGLAAKQSRSHAVLGAHERLIMKRSILAIILAGLVLLAGLGTAVLSLSRPEPVDARAMTAANELVAAGHYAEAAQMYEQLIARGARDAALYYNLGNATLSLGDAGRAVAAYEQAAALAPRDPDIRANRTLAQQQVRGQANRPPAHESAARPAKLPLSERPARGPVTARSAGPLGGLADVAGRWLTVDELALVALGAWFALGLLLFAYRGLQPERHPSIARVAAVVVFVVVLVAGGALAGRVAAPRLAAPATTAGQHPAENGGQQAAIPTTSSNPL